MKFLIAWTLAGTLVGLAGCCSTPEKDGGSDRRGRLPAVAQRVTIRHAHQPTRNGRDTVVRTTSKTFQSVTNQLFEWRKKGDTNFMVVLPVTSNVWWSLPPQAGTVNTNLARHFDPKDTVVLRGNRDTASPGDWVVRVRMQTRAGLPAGQYSLHYAILVGFKDTQTPSTMMMAAPSCYYDMVDATLVWDQTRVFGLRRESQR